MRNPRAADSLEGVARWRLLEDKIHNDIEETRQALRWLVSQGYLREESAKGSPPIFSLNVDKRRRVETFLTVARRPGKRRAN